MSDHPATCRYPYSLWGSYCVLRDMGESRVGALLQTPVYHWLRPAATAGTATTD